MRKKSLPENLAITSTIDLIEANTNCAGKTRALDEFFSNVSDDEAVRHTVGPVLAASDSKKPKQELPDVSSTTSQINRDEMLARELQLELDCTLVPEIEAGEESVKPVYKCHDVIRGQYRSVRSALSGNKKRDHRTKGK